MKTITGISAETAVGRLVQASFEPRNEDLYRARSAGKEPMPVTLIARDGTRRSLDCVYSPIPDGGYAVVVRDVTAMREVDKLSGAISTVGHELRSEERRVGKECRL